MLSNVFHVFPPAHDVIYRLVAKSLEWEYLTLMAYKQERIVRAQVLLTNIERMYVHSIQPRY